MEQNKSTWEGNKAIVATLADLKNGIAAIAASATKQQLPTGGAVEEKEMVRHDLEEKILEIGGQLSALAEVNKDVNLAAQVEFTLSSLDKLPDEALEATAKRVSTLTSGNLPALADYDVGQDDVAELDSLTNRFKSIKTSPRRVIAERVGQTATLPKLIADTTSLLRNRLDKQMIKFRKSNPEFFAGYQSARVIVDRGGSNGAEKPAPATAAAVK
jgi:hypothetical protein